MRYITLIVFIILCSFIQEQSADNKILKSELIQSNRAVSILQDYRTPSKVYPYIMPIHPDDFLQLTSPFGLRDIPSGIYTGGADTRIHNGIDLAGVWRGRVVAIADGIVIDHYLPPDGHFKGHPIFGGMIRIQQSDGRITIYGHLSKTYVKEQDFITQGQVIGRIGNTGLSDGRHLHLEISENGIQIQPLKYIEVKQ